MASKVSTLLDQVDSGALLLPEFQRGYVWNREQVRGFMRSMYRRYPVGSLLVWQTRSDDATVRGSTSTPPGYVDLLLDGQQRVTTLYGIARGRPPVFFEGNEAAFTRLHFHILDEIFEFYAPGKMRNDPLWIDVTKLMQVGLDPFIDEINASDELRPSLAEFVRRLNRLEDVKSVEFHIEQITGDDKGVDVVVEIFDRVNSGGTKLSKADLALAKLCAEWPDARERMRSAIAKWNNAGFNFKIDWLLRVVNAVVTGEALFSALARVPPAEFEVGLTRSEHAIDTLLNNLSSRLGLDHDRVVAGRFAFPVLARYLVARGGRFKSADELSKALYWYIQAFLWGRYAGPTETLLNQDLDAVDSGGIDQLVELIRLSRGDLTVRPSDFAGYGMGARFYPLLYLLTRTGRARDWWNGAPELSSHMLGRLAKLQIHHIFPKARLYERGYSRGQVNAIANFCFLTQETNLWVLARHPEEYFEMVEDKYPGALSSQWIPMDRSLWQLGRYPEFLEARRVLLAQAATDFLDGLLSPVARAEVEHLEPIAIAVEPEADPEVDEIREFVDWAVEAGYAKPDLDVEISDPETGETIIVAEAAWLNGLQEGIGDPVLLELDLTEDTEAHLVELGYKVFPSVESLSGFVARYAEEVAGWTGAEEEATEENVLEADETTDDDALRTYSHEEIRRRAKSAFVRDQVDEIEAWVEGLVIPNLHVRHNKRTHHSVYLRTRHLAGYYFAKSWIRFWLSGRAEGDEEALSRLSDHGRTFVRPRHVGGNIHDPQDLQIFKERLQARLRNLRDPSLLGAGQSNADSDLRILDCRETGVFDYEWWDRERTVEHFNRTWECSVEVAGRRIHARHGIGRRNAYGRDRVHSVTWLDGSPTVEGVEADDYEHTGCLISAVKGPDKKNVRPGSQMPEGYDALPTASHRDEINAPFSRDAVAVKLRDDDVDSWIRLALLRARDYGRLTA